MVPTTFWRTDEIFGDRLVIVQEDDPSWDSTDAAHPAWWRGQDHATKKWSARVGSLKSERDELLGVVKDMQGQLRDFENTKHELGLANGAIETYREILRHHNGIIDDLKLERDNIARDRDDLERKLHELTKENISLSECAFRGEHKADTKSVPSFLENWKAGKILPEYLEETAESYVLDWSMCDMDDGTPIHTYLGLTWAQYYEAMNTPGGFRTVLERDFPRGV